MCSYLEAAIGEEDCLDNDWYYKECCEWWEFGKGEKMMVMWLSMAGVGFGGCGFCFGSVGFSPE